MYTVYRDIHIYIYMKLHKKVTFTNKVLHAYSKILQTFWIEFQ